MSDAPRPRRHARAVRAPVDPLAAPRPTGFDPVLVTLLDIGPAIAEHRLPDRLIEIRNVAANTADPIRRAAIKSLLLEQLQAHRVRGAAELVKAVFDFEALLEPKGARPPAATLPSIDAGEQDLPVVSTLAWQALVKGNTPTTLFRRGVVCARLENGSGAVLPTVRVLTQDQLRFHLARTAKWYQQTDTKGVRRAMPPLAVVRDLLADPAPPLPPLTRIVGAPVFSADGQRVSAPGYHDSGIYYAPSAALTVPDIPSSIGPADRARARTILEDVVADFPFVGDAERAHALAFFLLPFARELIDGPTPLHLFEKPAPGTGASLLVDVLALPALGHSPPFMTAGRDEEEWRKRITAKLIGGSSIVLIDNVRARLDSDALSSAITAPTWEDRVLGGSQIVHVPVRCAWVATANNAALSNELARRTIRCRIDARMERPWERATFRHAPLRPWVLEHRGELVWAALVAIQGWLAEGRPASGATLGGFEEWSRVIGGVLKGIGVPGFLGNAQEFYELSDAEGAENSRLVALWWARFGATPVGVAELLPLAEEAGVELGGKTAIGQRTSLGRRLMRLRGRSYVIDNVGQRDLLLAGKASHSAQWRLAAPESGLGPGKVPEVPKSLPLFGPNDSTKHSTGDFGTSTEGTSGTLGTFSGPDRPAEWVTDSQSRAEGRNNVPEVPCDDDGQLGE